MSIIKRTSFISLFLISGNVFAEKLESMDITGVDSNPFLPKQERKRDIKIEPEGLVSYSFANNKNPVNSMITSTDYLNEAHSTAKYGYIEVESNKVKDFKTIERGYKDFKAELAMRSARSSLIKLGNEKTEYAVSRGKITSKEFTETFSMASGTYIPNKGWDTSTRIINSNKFGTMVITEWDFTLSDGGVLMDSDAVNQEINGNPAIMVIKQDKHDKSRGETILSWADKTKSYTIQLNRNISLDANVENLISLAENLPTAFSSSDEY